jgi:hypothetical protein
MNKSEDFYFELMNIYRQLTKFPTRDWRVFHATHREGGGNSARNQAGEPRWGFTFNE